jgi:hypothetical protein
MATQSPEITADLISSNARPDQVDVVDHTSKAVAISNAITQHQDTHNSHSIWADALGGVTNLASTVVHKLGAAIPGFKEVSGWANAGMQEMQKDFKFIGAIYKDRGVGEGLLATAGIAAGGFLGSAIGPEGSVAGAAAVTSLFATAGADIAAAGERNILGRVVPDFKLPMKQSSDPKFIMNPGFVVANALAKVPGLQSLSDTTHGWGQTVSGLTDMGFDFKTDPLMAFGKFTNILKQGKLLEGVAKDGAQIGVKVNMPLANDAPAIQNFFIKNSGIQYDASGIQMAYEYGKGIQTGGLLGKVGNVLNPFTGTAQNFYRAVQTIREETNPVAIQAMFPGSSISVTTAKRLAEADSDQKVIGVLADSLHTRELLQNGELQGMANRLVLPTQALPRVINTKVSDYIIQKANDPTLDETKNLLFSKKVAVKNADGKFLDTNGDIWDANSGVDKQYQRLGGGLYTLDAQGNYAAWNAMAGKIRTFTGYKALSTNPILMEQSAKNIDWQSPDAFVALYNMARYTMGKSAALEAAANVMKYAGDDAAMNTRYAQLLKEMVKGAGISDDAQVIKNVMSQVQRASMSGKNELRAYSVQTDGNVSPGIKMKDSIDENGNVTPGSLEQVALNESQLGSAPIVNFKHLRKAIQEANAYNRIYAKGDDFFTWYTERAFAPLTLFTTGFGMRVAAGEAMHEVMRNGLNNYLQNIVAANALRYDKDLMENPAMVKAVIKHRANAVVDGATPTDLANVADGSKELVSSNEMTKFIDSKKSLWDKAKVVSPTGFVAAKIAPYVAAEKLDVINRYQQLMGIILPSSMTATHIAKLSSATAEEVNTLAQLLRKPVKAGQDPLALFDYTHPSYHGYWAAQLNNWSKSA